MKLEQLEQRECPAVLYDPNVWSGYSPFPDFDGPIYHLLADVTGPEVNGVKILDHVFFAGTGAGPRVKILDGGRTDFVLVSNPQLPGTLVQQPRDWWKPLYDGFVFGDDTQRFGLVGAATTVADGRDSLWFGWGESNGVDNLKPGPVVSRVTFDGEKFTRRESFVLEETYRGAVQLLACSLDTLYTGTPDLLVLPQSRIGGPRVQVLDGVTGQIKKSWFFDSSDSRPEFEVAETLVGSRVGQFASPPDNRSGLGIRMNNRTYLYDWDGNMIVSVGAGDSGTEWRS